MQMSTPLPFQPSISLTISLLHNRKKFACAERHSQDFRMGVEAPKGLGGIPPHNIHCLLRYLSVPSVNLPRVTEWTVTEQTKPLISSMHIMNTLVLGLRQWLTATRQHTLYVHPFVDPETAKHMYRLTVTEKTQNKRIINIWHTKNCLTHKPDTPKQVKQDAQNRK